MAHSNNNNVHVNNMNNNFSVMSYNMHGYNQGEVLLKDVCQLYLHDLIFLQEHWLAPSNLHKLASINDEYVSYGKSAMEDVRSALMLCSVMFRL